MRHGVSLLFMILTGCGLQPGGTASGGREASWAVSAEEARVTPYRFAFSGQVLDQAGEVIPLYSVSVLSGEADLDCVLNPFGEKNGLIHLSRSSKHSDVPFSMVQLFISAIGYKSQLFSVKVGVDCDAGFCQGSAPLPLILKKAMVESESASSLAQVDPRRLAAEIKTSGVHALFRDLLSRDKLGERLVHRLRLAKNADQLPMVLIELTAPDAFLLNQAAQQLLNPVVHQLRKAKSLGLSQTSINISKGFAATKPLRDHLRAIQTSPVPRLANPAIFNFITHENDHC